MLIICIDVLFKGEIYMGVYINLFPPFSCAVGRKKLVVNLEENKILFKDLIYLLINDYPEMKELFPDNINRDNFYGNCYSERDGKLLDLEDYIKDGDTISLYASLSGG